MTTTDRELLQEALTVQKALVKMLRESPLQGREYDTLGIQLNTSIDHIDARLAAPQGDAEAFTRSLVERGQKRMRQHIADREQGDAGRRGGMASRPPEIPGIESDEETIDRLERTIAALRQQVAEANGLCQFLNDAHTNEYTRAEAAERERDAEKAIVDRIWDQLGRPSYKELAGRSIYDLIDALRKDAEWWKAEAGDIARIWQRELCEHGILYKSKSHWIDFMVLATQKVMALAKENGVKCCGMPEYCTNFNCNKLLRSKLGIDAAMQGGVMAGMLRLKDEAALAELLKKGVLREAVMITGKAPPVPRTPASREPKADEKKGSDIEELLAQPRSVSIDYSGADMSNAAPQEDAESLAMKERDRQYHMDAINRLASFLALSGTSFEVVQAAIDNMTRMAQALAALRAQVEDLKESHIMQLAAISTVSFENSRKSTAPIGKENPYWTVAYEDVATAIQREIRHRERAEAAEQERDALRKAIELARYRINNVGVVGDYLDMPTVLRESVIGVFDAAMQGKEG